MNRLSFNYNFAETIKPLSICNKGNLSNSNSGNNITTTLPIYQKFNKHLNDDNNNIQSRLSSIQIANHYQVYEIECNHIDSELASNFQQLCISPRLEEQKYSSSSSSFSSSSVLNTPNDSDEMDWIESPKDGNIYRYQSPEPKGQHDVQQQQLQQKTIKGRMSMAKTKIIEKIKTATPNSTPMSSIFSQPTNYNSSHCYESNIDTKKLYTNNRYTYDDKTPQDITPASSCDPFYQTELTKRNNFMDKNLLVNESKLVGNNTKNLGYEPILEMDSDTIYSSFKTCPDLPQEYLNPSFSNDNNTITGTNYKGYHHPQRFFNIIKITQVKYLKNKTIIGNQRRNILQRLVILK